jgi:hypothetical protein
LFSPGLEKNGVKLLLTWNFSILFFLFKFFREKYAQFFQQDFPRVPFIGNHQTFKYLASLGQRLINLHILKSSELNTPIVKYQGQDDDHTIDHPTTLRASNPRYGLITSAATR